MSTTILSSTFLLTLLLAIGLVFFIRASVKDRIKRVKLVSAQSEELLLTQLQQYFTQRAYQVTTVDPKQNQVTFQGYVRPSLFLAIFLSLLAGFGILCLALVLSQLFPDQSKIFAVLLLLAPAAGIFYWRKAGRTEQVSLQVETLAGKETGTQNLITVTAHRDELENLQEALGLEQWE